MLEVSPEQARIQKEISRSKAAPSDKEAAPRLLQSWLKGALFRHTLL